jgi:hypothetical protein
MANKRVISSAMWEDEFFTSLPIFDRLLWIGLITCAADDQGRIQDNPALIRSKVFPLDDVKISEVDAALSNFKVVGKIDRYAVNGKHAIQIINWWKHQASNWAGKSLLPAPEKWIDRERYHGKNDPVTGAKVILTSNWDKIGGYVVDYVDNNIDNSHSVGGSNEVKVKVNGEVNVKGEGENETSAPDLFDVIQVELENNGVLVNNVSAIKAVNEIIAAGITIDDIRNGLEWKRANTDGRVIYAASLIGPSKTAMQKRLQNNGGCANLPMFKAGPGGRVDL